MRKPLNQNFFERSALKVAPELLGKFLVIRKRGKKLAFMITETEAYLGLEDKASHASKGLTPRNKIMFGPGGYWYVYLIYGMYWLLNIITGKKGHPSGVLIRGVANSGHPMSQTFMHFSRKRVASGDRTSDVLILNGPGKLTKALGITKKFNNKPANKKTGLWIEDRGVRIGKNSHVPFAKAFTYIKKGPRIGVDYAGPVWSKKHYRFWIENN